MGIGKGYVVTIGAGALAGTLKSGGAIGGGQFERAGQWHHGEAAVFGDAGAAHEVAAAEALDASVLGVVGGDAFGFASAGLRGPLGHAERHAHGGKSLAIARRSDQRIDRIGGRGGSPGE